MHILLVSNYAPPYGGDIQVVMGQLAGHYVAAGHRVTILAGAIGIPRGTSEHDGVTRIGVPVANFLERRGIPFPLFDPLALSRALRALLPQVDVVHVHGLLYLDSMQAARMARRHGLPVVLTEHVGKVPFNRRLLNAAQKLALRTIGRLTCQNCTAVTVLNRRIAREIAPLLRPGTPLCTVPNGVDTELFRPADDRAAMRALWNFRRQTVLFAGRLTQKKRIDLIVKAALRAPGLDFVVCGQDTERLGMTLPNLRVLGQVDQPTLAQLYGAADVLVLPSEGEGLPPVVQEALACGLPVVVIEDETNREYLDENVAAFTARDPGAILAAVHALLDDPERWAQMSAAGRRLAVERFDWDETCRQYLALYQGATCS